MVSIVRRPGMTDAQYRAAVKSASDSMRRANRRHRNRYKTGKVYYNPRTKMYGNSPFPGGVEVASPRKGPVQRPPRRPNTLGRIFKDASTKPEGGFLKALGDSPMTNIIKKAKSPRQLERERIQKERDKILKARGPVKPTRQPSVTSRYRGGSGKKKYNQAAYFAGLGVNPNTKQNQGIYKPYANGGGVRKPKYKE